MIKLFRINTGSCGACDAEIIALVQNKHDFTWAADPLQADVLLLTGPLTTASKPAFMQIWHELGDQRPLLAVGRCAIDGHPFGRGGLADNPDIVATAKVDGCPPDPEALAAAIRTAAAKKR